NIRDKARQQAHSDGQRVWWFFNVQKSFHRFGFLSWFGSFSSFAADVRVMPLKGINICELVERNGPNDSRTLVLSFLSIWMSKSTSPLAQRPREIPPSVCSGFSVFWEVTGKKQV
ncbi:MAG: hypothetical protein ACE5G1_08340, partial [bacterium]